MSLIGRAKLRDLTACQVGSALVTLSADRSTRTLQIAHNALVRAIGLAESYDLVGRNVASLVSVPTGTLGRPSKPLTLDQARSLIEQARRVTEKPATVAASQLLEHRLAYSVDAAATVTGLSRYLFCVQMRTGKLGYLKIGRRRIITREQLAAFLALRSVLSLGGT